MGVDKEQWSTQTGVFHMEWPWAFDAVCNAELQTNTINTKDAGDRDLIFKRNDTNVLTIVRW